MSAKTRIIFVGSLSDPAAEQLRVLGDAFDLVEVADLDEAQRRFREGDAAAILGAGASFRACLEHLGRDWDPQVLEDLPDAVCLVDAESSLIWGNARFRRLCQREDVIGEDFFAAIGAAEILGPEFSPLQISIVTGEGSTTRLQLGERGFFQLHVSPVSGLGSSGAKLIVVVRDVTSEVHQQQKLEAIHRAGSELTDLRPEDLIELSEAERADLLKSNILHHTQAVFDFDVVEVRLLNKSTGQLTPLLAEGLDPVAANRTLYARMQDNGVTGFVAASSQSYLCEDASEDTLFLQGFQGSRSSLTVPLMLHNEVIGTFNVESPQPHGFSETDQRFLEIYAGNVAMALNTLDLLEAQGAVILQKGIEAIHRAVALPIDQILNETVQVLEIYRGGDLGIADRLKTILRRVRDLRQLIQEVGRGLAPTDAIPLTAPTPSSPGYQHVRVLVVDRDSSILENAHSILEKHGFDVETARTGDLALAMIRNCHEAAPYKVMIAELDLSGMSAYDLFLQLQGIFPDKVPLILMKGYGWERGHVHVKCREAGLHKKALVHKPFLEDQLLDVIAALLDWQNE